MTTLPPKWKHSRRVSRRRGCPETTGISRSTGARRLEFPRASCHRAWHTNAGCGLRRGSDRNPGRSGRRRVTGVDIASNLIEQARARAKAEGVEARFEKATRKRFPTRMLRSIWL